MSSHELATRQLREAVMYLIPNNHPSTLLRSITNAVLSCDKSSLVSGIPHGMRSLAFCFHFRVLYFPE